MGNNIYALLVSVGNYEKVNIKNLPSYKTDLAVIKTALVFGLKCENDNMRVISGENNNGTVNALDLAKGISELKKILKNEDTFVFYFSGHGSETGLIFSDGQINQQNIINYIDKIDCKNKIMFIDCCYSGNFKTEGAKHISFEQSVEKFAGYGTAVYASSSADEVSRLDENGKCSVFTGALSAALILPNIVHKGRIELTDIYQKTQNIICRWNKNNPEKKQNPIFRSSIGGTVYFDVSEYKPYKPKKIYIQTDKYIITDVKSLSNVNEKRLAVFVILKGVNNEESIVKITKEIVSKIKYADVYANIESEKYFFKRAAKVVWCYFGCDERDIINHNHKCYTIWASLSTKNKYYRENKNAKVINGIYLYKNMSYDLIRKMQIQTIDRNEYINQFREFLRLFICMSEDFITDIMEVKNRTITYTDLQKKYSDIIKEVKKEYIRLSDTDIPPDDLRDWSEEILSLSGWVLDLSIFLEGNKYSGTITEREEWLIDNTVKHYYESIEKIKELEKNIDFKTAE